jgi:hypothetical protein
MFARWVLAVASEIPHRRAAALRPSPLRISAASAASMEVRSKRRRKFICRRRRTRSRSVTVTMATGLPKPIHGTSGSRVSDRSGATVTRSGDRGRSRGTSSSPPGPPTPTDLRAHEATSFCNASRLPATARRPSHRNTEWYAFGLDKSTD